MYEFALWLESTSLSRHLFAITWLWPLCESLHFLGLSVLIGCAGFLDLRLMGLFRGVSFRAIRSFMPYAIAGFLVNAVTGFLFVLMQPHLYLSGFAWWLKMGFVVVAGLNALFFETRLRDRAIALDPYADTPSVLKWVGGVSLFSWFAVLYFGRMLPYLGTGN